MELRRSFQLEAFYGFVPFTATPWGYTAMSANTKTRHHGLIGAPMRLVVAFLGLQIAVASAGASESVVYEEDFSTDPNFTEYYTPTSSEYFAWDDGVYKVRISDASDVHKYALSPQFSKVEAVSFTVRVDINRRYVSYGQGIGVRFFDSALGYEQRFLSIHHKGSTEKPSSKKIRIGDAEGSAENVYWSPVTSPDIWYRVTISYHAVSNTADIEIVERDTSLLFYQETDVPFNPAPFDTIGLGDHTIWGEGTYAEMHYDNIEIFSGRPGELDFCCEDQNTLGDQDCTHHFWGVEYQTKGEKMCGSFSAAEVVHYWAKNGYPELLDDPTLECSDPAIWEDLVCGLCSRMPTCWFLSWLSSPMVGATTNDLVGGIITYFGDRGVAVDVDVKAAEWSTIKTELDEGRPVIYHDCNSPMASPAGSNHFAPICGYVEDGGRRVIQICEQPGTKGTPLWQPDDCDRLILVKPGVEPSVCGTGVGLAFLVPPVIWLHRRRRGGIRARNRQER